MAIFLFGCEPMWIQTKRYSGDGTIRTCSSFLSGGYAIKFAEFDSAHPYSTSYRLSHVPQISSSGRGRDPLLYLRFQWYGRFSDWAEIQRGVTGKIRLILQDSEGRTVKSNELSLAEMTYTESQDVYGGYDLARTRLHFEPSRNYVLRVTYTPGAIPLPANRLYFEIHDCAYY
jgi:hypothetical protein